MCNHFLLLAAVPLSSRSLFPVGLTPLLYCFEIVRSLSMLCSDSVLLILNLLGVLRSLGEYFSLNLEYLGFYFFKILFCHLIYFFTGTPSYMYIPPFFQIG